MPQESQGQRELKGILVSKDLKELRAIQEQLGQQGLPDLLGQWDSLEELVPQGLLDPREPQGNQDQMVSVGPKAPQGHQEMQDKREPREGQDQQVTLDPRVVPGL